MLNRNFFSIALPKFIILQSILISTTLFAAIFSAKYFFQITLNHTLFVVFLVILTNALSLIALFFAKKYFFKELESDNELLNLERQESATLMSSISDAILAIDQEGIPLFFNSRFALLLSREKIKKGTLGLHEMFENSDIIDAFHMALHHGQHSSVKAIPFEQESGKRYYSLSISPLTKKDGTVYGAVGIFHDVTDLKVAEQIRSDFVANVSHELRTPLTSIKGYADTIIQDLKDGRVIESTFLEVITRNVDRLIHLINDLLDISSLEASADLLQKESLSTKEITEKVISHMQTKFDSRNQTVHLNIQSQFVFADPTRLEQVLVNLLDNANKYTPSGGKISVSWEIEKNKKINPSPAILLKVSDSGPGIPQKHHPRVFERFYRIDKARSREMGGTGLGLAIVKHIMQRHDGSVWVESTLGQGATFLCKFP